MAPGYPKAREFIDALALRPLPESGRVIGFPLARPIVPEEVYILLGNGAYFWIRRDGSYVSGANPFGERYAKHFRWLDRWRLSRAVNAWIKRNEPEVKLSPSRAARQKQQPQCLDAPK